MNELVPRLGKVLSAGDKLYGAFRQESLIKALDKGDIC